MPISNQYQILNAVPRQLNFFYMGIKKIILCKNITKYTDFFYIFNIFFKQISQIFTKFLLQ